MEKAEKTINQILSINAPKNAVDESITFSLACKLFKEAHNNILTEQLSLLKLNPSFVLSACNIVENLYDKCHKTNKKELATIILRECLKQKDLDYYGEELKHLEVIIEDLHSNRKIKKISLKKKLGNKLGNFFLFLLS
jgi:hypothetical protein